MQFSNREDIEAPAEFVFEQVTDFTVFERQALRRGADVRRKDATPGAGVGSSWDVTFKFRGKDRQISIEVTDFDAPNSYTLATRSGGVTGETVVELVPLSRSRTRLSVKTDLAAHGLTARLLLQSLKLAKANLNQRMATRIASYALDIQERYARQS